MRQVRGLIIGPPDTPYEFGFFEVRRHKLLGARVWLMISVLAQFWKEYNTHLLFVTKRCILTNQSIHKKPQRSGFSRRIEVAHALDQIYTLMGRSACEFSNLRGRWRAKSDERHLKSTSLEAKVPIGRFLGLSSQVPY